MREWLPLRGANNFPCACITAFPWHEPRRAKDGAPNTLSGPNNHVFAPRGVTPLNDRVFVMFRTCLWEAWRPSFVVGRLTVVPMAEDMPMGPRRGELRTQKLKSRLRRTQSLKVLPLKPGVGQYIAIRAALTARDVFLAIIYPSGPFTCIFPQNFSQSFPVLAAAYAGSCVGPQNKNVTLLDAGSLVECPWNRNRLKKIYLLV